MKPRSNRSGYFVGQHVCDGRLLAVIHVNKYMEHSCEVLFEFGNERKCVGRFNLDEMVLGVHKLFECGGRDHSLFVMFHKSSALHPFSLLSGRYLCVVTYNGTDIEMG